jgi:predicted membrane channel-forming protein YqfA (hemolysin III family)
MKRITQKPWFGEKIVGWGPAPVTWQGWIITLLLILTVILDLTGWKLGMNRKKRENPLITVIYLIIMIALIVLLDTMTYLKHDFMDRLIVNIIIVIVFLIVYLIFIRKL